MINILNLDHLVLTVKDIEETVKFYEKLGFKDTGKRFEEEKFRFKNGANIPQMEMVIKK